MSASLFGTGGTVNVNVNGTLVPQSFTATSGQVLFTLNGWTYTPGTNSLLVFINGQRQILGRDFTETSTGSFTLLEGCVAGDFVDVIGFPQIDLTAVNSGVISLGGGYSLANYISDSVINVKNYPYLAKCDGVSDDTSAIQAAINAAGGRTIIIPAGTYVISSALTYNTSGESPGLVIIGDGIGKTIFNNKVANAAMLSLDGSGTPSTYGLGFSIEGLSIITTTSPAASRGIDIKGQWFGKFSRIKIKSLTSDGIRLVNNNSDSDSSAAIEFDKIWVQSCGGWGFNATDPTVSSNATSQLIYKQCYFGGNSLGGARVLGGQIEFTKCAIAYNGGTGIVFPYSAIAGANNLIKILNTEFDDNTGFDVDIQSCLSGSLELNKFVYRTNRTGIRIGDGGAGGVQYVKCVGNFHRRDSGTVTLHSVGSNASYTDVFDSVIPSGTGVTPITDSGSYTRYRSQGLTSKNAVATTTTTGAGSYTPDVFKAVYHRIVVNAAGAFTVNAPINGVEDGQELELDIYNVSGGAITVTLNAVFAKAGYTDPANGKRTTCKFRYHGTSGAWVQIGSWSPAI